MQPRSLNNCVFLSDADKSVCVFMIESLCIELSTNTMDYLAPKSVLELPTCFQSVFAFRNVFRGRYRKIGDDFPKRHLSCARKVFSYFNSIQSECFDELYHQGSRCNSIVSAPTAAGKTVILELAILSMLRSCVRYDETFQSPRGTLKAIYIAPTRSLVQEKAREWAQRFGNQCLGLQVREVTGDTEKDSIRLMHDADIICTTPEKLDSLTRRAKDGIRILSEIRLVLLDEVHLLNESHRGSALEAGVVSRLRLAHKEMEKRLGQKCEEIRFVACSATVPNIDDIAAWLQVPAQGMKVFGEEMRPIPLQIVVKGYTKSKNDFLFDKRLTDHISTVVQQYSHGKPSLVFCPSRLGSVATASRLLQDSKSFSKESQYISNESQKTSLAEAARSVRNSTLRECIRGGIGFHHAALEPSDRSVVESLFNQKILKIVCTTSTLAVGVNMPAYLVVIKGTKRYCGSSGGGYQDYDYSSCLQMVGRAGRPQFDQAGMAVIMTENCSVSRYQDITSRAEVVESRLGEVITEYMNAEIVLGTVNDPSSALQWLKSTFLYVRARREPFKYGFPRLQVTGSDASVDSWIEKTYVTSTLEKLIRSGMVERSDDGTMQAAQPGVIMSESYIKLHTMMELFKVRHTASMEDLLWVIAKSSELSSIMIRRSEKKVLNALNDAPQSSIKYKVLDSKKSPRKVLKRVQEPCEKIFLLMMYALSSSCSDLKLDYSLKQECEQILSTGKRIAGTMVRYFSHMERSKELCDSIVLRKVLTNRKWQDDPLLTTQLPSVGIVTALKLSKANLVDLRKLAEVDPRHLEKVTDRAFPWGNQILNSLAEVLPPRLSVELNSPKWDGPRLLCFSVSITTLDAITSQQLGRKYCLVLVQDSRKNKLLAYRRVQYSAFQSDGYNLKCKHDIENDTKFVDIGVDIIDEELVGVDMSLTTTLQSGNDVSHLCNTATKRHKSGQGASRQTNANATIQDEAGGIINLKFDMAAENTATNNVIDLTTPVPSPSLEKDRRGDYSHSAIPKKENQKADRRIWDRSPPMSVSKTTMLPSYQDFFGCTYRTSSS